MHKCVCFLHGVNSWQTTGPQCLADTAPGKQKFCWLRAISHHMGPSQTQPPGALASPAVPLGPSPGASLVGPIPRGKTLQGVLRSGTGPKGT